MEQLREVLLRQALVIDKGTAKALGIIIPPSLRELARCLAGVWLDQVVDGIVDTPRISHPNQKRNGPGRAATEAVLAWEVRS